VYNLQLLMNMNIPRHYILACWWRMLILVWL